MRAERICSLEKSLNKAISNHKIKTPEKPATKAFPDVRRKNSVTQIHTTANVHQGKKCSAANESEIMSSMEISKRIFLFLYFFVSVFSELCFQFSINLPCVFNTLVGLFFFIG